jgi:hypothetical protein
MAVFHTNAGHITLHDVAYNGDRNITTGNPYSTLSAPRIKVNTDAMARTTQLVQQGFMKITE